MPGLYAHIDEPIVLTRAGPGGIRAVVVDVGTLVVAGTVPLLGRVLGLATHDGERRRYAVPRLAVAVLASSLDHCYLRHVPREDVHATIDPANPLCDWFLGDWVAHPNDPSLAARLLEAGYMTRDLIADVRGSDRALRRPAAWGQARDEGPREGHDG